MVSCAPKRSQEADKHPFTTQQRLPSQRAVCNTASRPRSVPLFPAVLCTDGVHREVTHVPHASGARCRSHLATSAGRPLDAARRGKRDKGTHSCLPARQPRCSSEEQPRKRLSRWSGRAWPRVNKRWDRACFGFFGREGVSIENTTRRWKQKVVSRTMEHVLEYVYNTLFKHAL